LEAEGKGGEVAVLLCGDDEMAKLNQRFRSKPGATNVLSFPDGQNGRLGDIAISVETARLEAREAGEDIQRRVSLLAVHGLLHLLGYDHQTKAEAHKMAARENCYLGSAMAAWEDA